MGQQTRDCERDLGRVKAAIDLSQVIRESGMALTSSSKGQLEGLSQCKMPFGNH